MARRRKSKKKNSLFGGLVKRLVRSALAIIILSAFVLGIAYTVKETSDLSPKKIASLASPLLAKIGLSEEMVGEVAGDLIKRATDIGIEGDSIDSIVADTPPSEIIEEDISSASTNRKELVSLVFIADTHIANDKQDYIANKDFLRQLLTQLSDLELDSVVHVGDITNWGVKADLKEVKGILEGSGIKYHTLPGDRDLAAVVGPENYDAVFDSRFETFEIDDFKFVLFDNSANYTLIDSSKIEWFATEVEDADFVILSQPLYASGMFNCQYMGSFCSEPEVESLIQKQKAVLSQRNVILDMVRNSNVKAVIAGDHHKFSETKDLEDPTLMHYIVGALGKSGGEGTIEYSVLNSFGQNYSILNIFEDGTFEMTTVPFEITP